MNDVLRPDDTRDTLRNLGGVLVGIGALMLVLRKEEEWARFPIFLTYLVPAVLLYGGALATRDQIGGLRPWQAVYSVFGLLFIPFTLSELVNIIGDPGDAGNALNVFWIFAVTAAAGFYAGLVAGVRFQLLAGSVAAIVSWMALWDEIVGFEDDLGLFRGFLGLAAIGLIVIGIVVWRSAPGDAGVRRFSEVFTGAGIAAVVACALSITAAVQFAPQFGLFSLPGFEANLFWDTLLLLISHGLIAVGTVIGTRGPVYIGAIGLLLFLFIAGLDLNDETPEAKVVGWPLLLLIVGGVAILASGVRDLTLGDRPRRLVDQLSGRR